MSDTNERSVASTGSVAEPAAWGVVDDRGLQLAIHATPERASHMARNFGVGLAVIVPLYRQPQPTLTDAELRAVRQAAFAYAQNDDDAECAEIASALLGLAERLK